MSEATEPNDEMVEQDTEEVLADEEGDVSSGDGIPGIPGRLTSMLPDQVTQMMQLLNQENGVAKVLLKPAYAPDEDGNPQVSQAEAIADMVNILRLDTKRIAEEVGAEVEVKRVTPERAAVMVQDLIKQEDMALIEAFAEIEDQREEILRQVADDPEEVLEEHREQKRQVSYFAQVQEEDDEA